PRPLPDAENPIPSFQPEQHAAESLRLASWAYYLRTTNEPDLGHRNFIESNVRAMAANSRWDGSIKQNGWRATGWFGDGDNRALLQAGNEEPEADGLARYRGFGGPSISATGETHLMLFDVPEEPLLSLGQLQHANVGRYNNEPSYVVGNSYHNIRIPLDETVIEDFARFEETGEITIDGLHVFDLSHRINEKLWDSWFFSTVDANDLPGQFAEISEGEYLPNSRYRFFVDLEEIETRFTEAASDQERYDALAGGMVIDGAFNVNSTSVEAWKVVLSSLRDTELPVYDPVTGNLNGWERGDVVFSRFARPYSEAFKSGGSDDNYWRGFRELGEDEVTDLAEKIVEQVKLRGPFRSLGDFVNRSL
ncbi:MAG: hypothetical protein AAF357_20070, partial [Verrucomicrobiota bacterium]